MARRTGERLAPAIERKYARLQSILKDMDCVLVAFSGGVDSTLVLKAAHDALGRRALAVTAASVIHPAWETREARDIARAIGARSGSCGSNRSKRTYSPRTRPTDATTARGRSSPVFWRSPGAGAFPGSLTGPTLTMPAISVPA